MRIGHIALFIIIMLFSGAALLSAQSQPAVNIAQLPSSSIPPECSPSSIGNIMSNSGSAIGIALLALTVSFDVVAIAYMINKLFPSSGVGNWIQNEYWEIAKSAIIIVSIFAIITLVGNLTYAIVPTAFSSTSQVSGFTDITPLINGAENYLCTVNANTYNVWELMGIMSAGTGFWSTFQVSAYDPFSSIASVILSAGYLAFFYGANIMPFGNWMLQSGNFMIAPFGSIINDFINFVMFPFTSFNLGLITLLPSLATIGLMFLIPMGLVFRALPFIRGIGGTLIALGIGLCIILPSVLLLFNYPITNALTSAIPLVYSNPNNNLPSYSCPFSSVSGTFGFILKFGCILFPATYLVSILPLGSNYVGQIGFSSAVFNTNAIFYYMNYIVNYGAYVIVQLLLLVMDIIIIYPLVNETAKMMGGTIRLQIGGKLRLA